MIVVLAEVEVDPGNVEAMKDAVREMEIASLEEPGCHEYIISQALSDPGKLRINELWESMEALEAHFGLPHMARFQETLQKYPPRSMKLRVHELGAEQKLPGRRG